MKHLLLAVAMSLAWCERQAPEPVPPPHPLPGEFTCETACENFRLLGCEEYAPTPMGGTCVQVCENAQRTPAPMDLGCIVRAESCEQARACE